MIHRYLSSLPLLMMMIIMMILLSSSLSLSSATNIVQQRRLFPLASSSAVTTATSTATQSSSSSLSWFEQSYETLNNYIQSYVSSTTSLLSPLLKSSSSSTNTKSVDLEQYQSPSSSSSSFKLAVNFGPLSDATKNAIKEKYAIGNQAQKFRTLLPHFYGPTSLEPTSEYGIATALYAAPGILLFSIAAIIMLFYGFCSLSYCCCKCCWPLHCFVRCCEEPKPRSLNFRRSLFFFTLTSSLMIITAIILALVNNSLLHAAFSGNGSPAVVEASQSLLSSSTELTAALNESKQVDNQPITTVISKTISRVVLSIPMLSMALDVLLTSIPTAVSNVNGQLGSVATLRSEATAVTSLISDFSTDYSSVTATGQQGSSPTFAYDCIFCPALSSSTSTLASELQTTATDMFDSFESVANNIQTELVSMSNTITTAISDAKDNVDAIHDSLSSSSSSSTSALQAVDQVENSRLLYFTIFICLYFIPVIIIVIYYFLKSTHRKRCALKCNIWLSLFLLLPLCLLLALVLPLGSLVADSCIYINDRDYRLDEWFSYDVANFASGCMTGKSVVEILEMEDDLDFRSKIVFPDFPAAATAFQVSALTEMNTQLANANYNDFSRQSGGNTILLETDFASTLASINVAVDPDRTRADVFSWTSDNTATQNGWKAMINAAASADTHLTSMRADMSTIIADLDDLSTNTQTYQNDVNNMETFLNPVFDDVDDVIDLGQCSFAADAYLELKQRICEDQMQSFYELAIAIILLTTFSYFFVLLSCCLLCSRQSNQFQIDDEHSHGVQFAVIEK